MGFEELEQAESVHVSGSGFNSRIGAEMEYGNLPIPKFNYCGTLYGN